MPRNAKVRHHTLIFQTKPPNVARDSLSCGTRSRETLPCAALRCPARMPRLPRPRARPGHPHPRPSTSPPCPPRRSSPDARGVEVSLPRGPPHPRPREEPAAEVAAEQPAMLTGSLARRRAAPLARSAGVERSAPSATALTCRRPQRQPHSPPPHRPRQRQCQRRCQRQLWCSTAGESANESGGCVLLGVGADATPRLRDGWRVAVRAHIHAPIDAKIHTHTYRHTNTRKQAPTSRT